MPCDLAMSRIQWSGMTGMVGRLLVCGGSDLLAQDHDGHKAGQWRMPLLGLFLAMHGWRRLFLGPFPCLGFAAVQVDAQRLGRAAVAVVRLFVLGRLGSHGPGFPLRTWLWYGIKCAPSKARCRSSGVEHVLGKDGVGGSIPL